MRQRFSLCAIRCGKAMQSTGWSILKPGAAHTTELKPTERLQLSFETGAKWLGPHTGVSSIQYGACNMTSRIFTLKSALLAVVAGGLVSAAGVSAAASPVANTAQAPAIFVAAADAGKVDASKTDGQHARKGKHHRHHHAKHWGGRHALLIPGVGPLNGKLISSLELTDAQKAL